MLFDKIASFRIFYLKNIFIFILIYLYFSIENGQPREPALYVPIVSAHFRSLLCIVTHTHPFNSPLPGTTRVTRYQKDKTNLDFTEARDSEWQWHQLGYMQVCTSLQTDNHPSIPPLSFLQAGCPSCHPTNSVKALKATIAYSQI